MKSIVVANWKMNPATFGEAKRLFDATREAVESASSITLVLAPPAIFLRELRSRYKGKRLAFALQNASAEGEGAFTGEISLGQAKDAGATYVIVGHSERRYPPTGNGETNEMVGKAASATLEHGLIPILCIGEKTRTQSGEHFNFVREQLRTGLAGIGLSSITKIFVAYEPVWTIGGEKAMTPRDMHEMAIFIRKTVVELYGEKGMNTKILYGGAVTESNAKEMVHEGGIIGLLVGHVSLNADRFAALLHAVAYAT